MRALVRIVLGLAALLAIAVVGVLVYLSTLDVEEYRGTIETAVAEATGRKLELVGPIDLAIGLRPALVIEDARFGNVGWGSRPEMARLERLEVQVELRPLLSGEIRLNRLLLVAPDILLETDSEGRGNWTLAPPGEDSGTKGDPPPGGSAPIPLVEEVRLERATLTYLDGKTNERRVLALEELTAKADSFDDPLAVRVRGRWGEVSFDVSGELGPLAAIRDPTVPFSLDLAGDVSPFGEVAVATRVEGDLSGKMRFEDLEVRVGGNAFSGRLEASTAGALPRVTAILRADKPLALPGTDGGSARTEPPSPRGKVFSREPLPFGSLRSANADLSLAIAELGVGRRKVRDLELELKLEDGRLRIDPLRMLVAESRMTGALDVDASGATPEIVFRLDAPKVRLEELLRDERGDAPLREGQGDLAVRLRGRGSSAAEIAATLDGETKLLVGRTRARTRLLDVAVGGASRVLGMLFARGSEWSTIHCMAGDVRLENGIATPRILLVDTEHSTVVGEGQIDFRREALALKVTPEPKEVTLSVAVPIKVGGTLANPTYRPDELATAKKIGGLVSIVLFPPAAILSLAELGAGDNACLDLASGGGRPKSEGLTDKAAEAGKQVVDGIGSGARRVGEKLRGLFD